MTELRADLHGRAEGVTLEVLAAGLCVGFSFAATGFLVDGAQTGLNFAMLAGWCAFAVAAGLLLDRVPGSPEGRLFAGLSLIPLFTAGWATLRAGSLPGPSELAAVIPELSGIECALVGLLVPWVFCRPGRTPRLGVGAVLAASGAVVVARIESSSSGSNGAVAGWLLICLGAAVFWWELLAQAAAGDRTSRRRTTWLIVLLAGAGVATGGAWLFLPEDAAAYVTLSCLILVALGVARLRFLTGFRPIDEPALDLAAGIGALATAGLIGVLVWIGATWFNLPSPRTPAAFGAVLTLAVAAPVAIWLRRSATARRYGTGVISPGDVALITADLHSRTDARDLLDKAARMVAAASANRDVRVVLGTEPPELEAHEILHPLVVGGERVGALIVVPADPEGLEPRQQHVIEQLLPTVALVARAVGQAVDTEHARRDVTREREVERRRILNDLHDGLGPLLAGMSMRVQGAMRSQADPEVAALLGDLATDLATSRADLRRMVSGLTPTGLDEGDLEPALTRLLETFNGFVAGPRVAMAFSVDQPLEHAVEVAVYRLVAEGVTNAVRHASAETIEVAVRTADSMLAVEVTDDGTGGPVHPGVGLTSMRQRAEALGGTLAVATAPSGGVGLHLELPLNGKVRS